MRPEPCVVNRCRATGTVPLSWYGYICEQHAYSIWHIVEQRDCAKSDEPVSGREARDYIRVEARAKRAAGRRKPTAIGEIYFVRDRT